MRRQQEELQRQKRDEEEKLRREVQCMIPLFSSAISDLLTSSAWLCFFTAFSA